MLCSDVNRKGWFREPTANVSNFFLKEGGEVVCCQSGGRGWGRWALRDSLSMNVFIVILIYFRDALNSNLYLRRGCKG